MNPPTSRRRSPFIDAVIDDYASAHSTPPDADQRDLQRITQENTGWAAAMQIGDDQAVLMEMLVRAMERGGRWKSARSPGTPLWPWPGASVPTGTSSVVTSARSGRPWLAGMGKSGGRRPDRIADRSGD